MIWDAYLPLPLVCIFLAGIFHLYARDNLTVGIISSFCTVPSVFAIDNVRLISTLLFCYSNVEATFSLQRNIAYLSKNLNILFYYKIELFYY